MIDRLTRLAFPALGLLDAERAHELALLALQARLPRGVSRAPDPRLSVDWLGRTLPSPIGLAAGFDKNARCLPALMRLGFAALETGTVTPLPQRGNPRPRLFRLREDGAVINRMGFNNDGVARVAVRLRNVQRVVPVGVNVGPNKEGSDPPRDIPRLVAAVAPYADWVTINLSSPNTPGLRAWQTSERVIALLRATKAEVASPPPLLVKLAPDLDRGALADIVVACVEGGATGLIISNTTVARPSGLRSAHAREAGGLSGRPLMAVSTAILRETARLAAGRLALVGAGGVASGADVVAKLRAGATLVQLYTAFALQGPALLPRLERELLQELDRQGFPNARSAIGADL